MSTFSDNVIVSIIADPNYLLSWIKVFAGIQISLGIMGFWIRGAVTIGNLYHHEDAVFGPGLNRAYELESKSAVYPRIILDPELDELTSLQTDYIDNDARLPFLDPFRSEFLEEVMATPFKQEFVDHFNNRAGSSINPKRLPFAGNDWLKIFSQRLTYELSAAGTEAVREKYLWLLSRIAPRIK